MEKAPHAKKKNGQVIISPIERKTFQKLSIFGLAEHLNKIPISLYLLIKTKHVPSERENKQPLLCVSTIESYFLGFNVKYQIFNS